MTSVILSTPILILLYGAALLLCVYDLIRRATGYVFPLISALLFAAATVLSVCLGAGLAEVGGAALIFLALNLGASFKWGGDGK